MTDEEKDQAAVYLKLQENVQALVLNVITNELITNPMGTLAQQIAYIARHTIQNEMKQYRITKAGDYAQY